MEQADIVKYLGATSLLIFVYLLLKDDEHSRELLALVAKRSNMDVTELREVLSEIKPRPVKPEYYYGSPNAIDRAPNWSPLEDTGYAFADFLAYARSHSRYREEPG